MTVTTECQATVPAWSVEMGDYVYVRQLDDWIEVAEVRHTNTVLGWHVVLTLKTGIPRDFLVFCANDSVTKAV